MRATVEHWEDPEREHLPPMFGWLNTRLPYAEQTVNLATHVHTRTPGVVPWIQLDPATDHALAREARDGITWHRVAEINRSLLGDDSAR